MHRSVSNEDIPAPTGDMSLEEIQDVLMLEGYSADQRRAWLKGVLTALQQRKAPRTSSNRDQLISEVKGLIAHHQDEPPMSDDTL